MRSPSRIVVLLLIALAAAAANAATLEKYRGWGESPQGYFMTKKERRAWKRVRSDLDAEAFVASFLRKRGGQAFIQKVEKRVARADEYFRGFKLKGLPTLRKLIILFGAPSHLSVSAPQRDTRRMAAIPSTMSWNRDSGTTRGGTMTLPAPDGLAAGPVSGGYLRIYTLTYPAEALGAADGADRKIFLEADVGTLEDRFHKATKRRAVEAIEAVATASILEP